MRTGTICACVHGIYRESCGCGWGPPCESEAGRGTRSNLRPAHPWFCGDGGRRVIFRPASGLRLPATASIFCRAGAKLEVNSSAPRRCGSPAGSSARPPRREGSAPRLGTAGLYRSTLVQVEINGNSKVTKFGKLIIAYTSS